MNRLDAFIFAAAAVWCVVRSRRGALRVAIEFGGAAIGLWAAIRFTDSAALFMAQSASMPVMIGWPVAFILLLLVPTLIGQTLSEWTAARRSGRVAGVDRVLGGVIGIAEVFLLAGIGLVAFVEWGGRLHAPPLVDSLVVGWLLRIIPGLYDWAAEVLTL